jgi:hypothetical protein
MKTFTGSRKFAWNLGKKFQINKCPTLNFLSYTHQVKFVKEKLFVCAGRNIVYYMDEILYIGVN